MINLLLVSLSILVHPSYSIEGGISGEVSQKANSSEGYSSLIVSLFLPQDVEPEEFIPMVYYSGTSYESRFLNDGSIEGDIRGDGIFTALLKCARNQPISFYLFHKGSGGLNPIFKKEIMIRDEEVVRVFLSMDKDGKVEEKSEDVSNRYLLPVRGKKPDPPFTRVHLYIFFTIFLFFFFLLLFLHYEIERGVDSIVAAIRDKDGKGSGTDQKVGI